MPGIETVFDWIAQHEQVLSGVAAAIVIVGVVLAPIAGAMRRLRRRSSSAEPGRPALASVGPLAEPGGGRPSIAVLPFVDRTPGATLDGLCDGLTEDVISALSRVKPFFVIAHSTMLAYRESQMDARDVGRELGVRYVLAGHVVTSSGALRVSSELVDARSGVQVDAQRFERPLAELFALQDDITQHIVAALAPALKGAEAARARRSETASLDAWALVNRAHIRLSQDIGDVESIRAAVADCRRALELDAEYGLAWAVMGLALSLARGRRLTDLSDDPSREALDAVQRAVALDPDDATVHHCRGATMGNLGRTAEGVRAYERALAIDPNAAASLGGLGAALFFSGRAEDGRAALDRAIRLSPRDPLLYHWLAYRSLCELIVGRFEQARDDARASVERTPSRAGLAALAVALAHLGALEEAHVTYDRLTNLEPGLHPDAWGRYLGPSIRSETERERLIEGMWLASGLARDHGEAAHAP